jgi:hypothetical protein
VNGGETKREKREKREKERERAKDFGEGGMPGWSMS